jgi:hypothetical protein
MGIRVYRTNLAKRFQKLDLLDFSAVVDERRRCLQVPLCDLDIAADLSSTREGVNERDLEVYCRASDAVWEADRPRNCRCWFEDAAMEVLGAHRLERNREDVESIWKID